MAESENDEGRTYQVALVAMDERNEPKVHEHCCEQCGMNMGFEWFLGPVCGSCCRRNHRKVVGR